VKQLLAPDDIVTLQCSLQYTMEIMMKIKKTVSEKVLAANRANGQKTSGPKTCESGKLNAVKHGLLAKRLLLNEEQVGEFAELHGNLILEYQPQTETERIMVDDLATLRWKLQLAENLELRRLRRREKSAEIVFQTLAAERETDDLSKLTRANDFADGARVGWECTELKIIASNRKLAEEINGGDYKRTGVNDPRTSLSQSTCSKSDQSHGSILVEAKVNTGIESISRYERSLRRDFYRAMDILRRLKGKKGISGTGSDDGGEK
jgi:hypothetical protein